MKTYGSAAVYVAAQSHIDLPRPGSRIHSQPVPRCPDCQIHLARPGAFHVCLDLGQPEPVAKPLQTGTAARKRAEMNAEQLRKARAKDRAQRQREKGACTVCGTEVSRAATRCIPCQNQSRRKTTPEVEADIVQRYTQRYQSVAKIAREIGLAQVTVTGVLDRHDVPRPGKGNRKKAA